MKSTLLDNMKLTAIEIENFKSIESLKLEKLQELSLFIGNNGAGKSALFAALRFLRDCVLHGDITKPLEDFKGFDDLLYRGALNDRISIKVKLAEPENTKKYFSYALVIYRQDGELVVNEVLNSTVMLDNCKNLRLINYIAGKGFVQDTKKEYSLISKTSIALGVYGSIAKYANVAAFKAQITSWFFADFSAAKIREGFSNNILPTQRLKENASNLCNVLLSIQEGQPQVLDEIVKEVVYIAPDVTGISVVKGAYGLHLQVSSYLYKDKPFSMDSISDGLLKYITYIVLIKQLSYVSLLLIEEPENQIFLGNLVFLYETLLANTANTQTLVTSHSPEFIRDVDLRQVNIVAKDGPKTLISRLVSDKSLYSYLKTTTIVQAWQDCSLFSFPLKK